MDLSAVYLTSYYTTVTQRGKLDRKPRIACLPKQTTDRALQQRYGKDQIRHYATAEERLRAVSSGDADIAFLRQETAQQNIWQGDFSELVTSGVLTFSQDVAIGVASRMEPELLTILDKEIRFIGPNGIFDYTTFYEQKLDQRRSIQSLFYAYPQYFITQLDFYMLSRVMEFQKQRHATGMTVICEGIETREQEDMLRSCGCDQGQGYLYGKPMPEEEFERFLLQHI